MRWGVLLRRTIFVVLGLAILGAAAFLSSAGWNLEIATGRAAQYWMRFSNLIDQAYNFLDRIARFLAPFATLAGGGYAVYHKWQYNRSRMHIHIDEFIKREEERLREARKNLDRITNRPGPGRPVQAPIFLTPEVKRALRKMGWGRMPAAETSLEDELKQLDRQIGVLHARQADFRRHKAEAYLLRGAIAAARAASAKAAGKDGSADDGRALEHFQNARKADSTDLEAIEYVGHQRVLLGENTLALRDFEELERVATKKDVPLVVARSKKLRALILNRRNTENSLRRAAALLNRAFRELPLNAPRIEKAEIQEILGLVQENRGKINQNFTPASTALHAAKRLYEEIVRTPNSGDDVDNARQSIERCERVIERIEHEAKQQDERTPPPPDDQPQ